VGGFGGGENQGGADDRILLGGEPGAEGGTHRGVGVVEEGLQEGGVGGDRGPGGGDRPARRVAGHLDAVVVVEVMFSVGAMEQQPSREAMPK
jgi:hypothetical protein